MTKKIDREDFSIKRKNIPAFLSFVSIVLAIMWVGIVLFGVIREFDAESLKTLTGKKIVFSLLEDEELPRKQITEKNQVTSQIESKAYISILIELDNYSELGKLASDLPKEVSFGVSDKNIGARTLAHNNFLVHLPLTSYDNNKKFDIYPNIDPVTLKTRLNDLLKGSKVSGVYNIGNEEFLESDLQTFANIISYLKDKNLFLLYGVNDKTTVFESDSENIFSVEACDEIIDLKSDNEKQVIDKLRFFENIAIKKGKAVLFIKSEKTLPKKIVNWIQEIKNKGVSITAFSQLPKTIRDQ